MHKVLIIAKSNDSLSRLRTTVEKFLPYDVYPATDKHEIRTLLESKVFNLAFLEDDVIDTHTLGNIYMLRDMGYGFSIIVIGKRVENEVLSRVYSASDTHLLVGPTTEKAIVGLARKLMSSRRVPRQKFPRFNTNQIAQIETLEEGSNLLTSMYNLSKGGAYCEFDSPIPMTVGDMVRFRIQLNDLNSEYALSAKVVWTTVKGRFSGRFGCGFKFMSNRDMYKNLLSRT